jgi:hypothetical protein
MFKRKEGVGERPAIVGRLLVNQSYAAFMCARLIGSGQEPGMQLHLTFIPSSDLHPLFSLTSLCLVL